MYKKQLHEQNRLSHPKKVQAENPHSSLESEQISEISQAAKDLGATIKRFEDQMVLVHSERLSLDTKIGPYALRDLEPLLECWQSGYTQHPLSGYGLHADDLLFFDTETTGLGSGAGQMIFLIGLARWSSEGLMLNQYFLPGPGHEAAFYNAFLNDCHSLKNLVTFNGKAFDWPRVKTRHQFVRDQVPKLPSFGHFDLLHASRRLWKNRLDRVGLQTVESAILSMGRKQDVPGKMAPFLYFQFLKHPDAQLVKGIIEHNREDVLSLISLYIHLSNKILGRIDSDSEESYEIARWDKQIGNTEHAKEIWKSLANGDSSFGLQAKRQLAILYKREGAYRTSLDLFESIIHDHGNEDRSLYIEAAKLLEHQFKNYDQAIVYTKQALRLLDSIKTEDEQERIFEIKSSYLKRLNRLDQKRLGKYS
nr:ribonuclease H-like domain-containing protein [Sporolactobacillus kofuensis]